MDSNKEEVKIMDEEKRKKIADKILEEEKKRIQEEKHRKWDKFVFAPIIIALIVVLILAALY